MQKTSKTPNNNKKSPWIKFIGIFTFVVSLLSIFISFKLTSSDHSDLRRQQQELGAQTRAALELNVTVPSPMTDMNLYHPDISTSENDVSFDVTAYDSGYVVDSVNIDLTNLDSYFVVSTIPDDVFQYINGKSYTPNNDIQLDDLRYIKLLHYNYDHNIQVGELIVNKSIADEIKDIFIELFENEYEIEKMYLPDRYWTGDGNTTDDAACDDNNTSAFFYRRVGGSNSLSNHAYGLAIDINPQQNPYVSYRNGSAECIHENALAYLDRTSGAAHMITTNDLCYQLFVSHGYTWGGSWRNIKDYQHFEK